ncbi:homocysteine S-methyltransferase family protein [Clostridium algoriphilum]|nr:homocysteine S-methyltransferase family protein [Clostridium algoriphilum]MCB2292594.1 homocysteine S-methyltransferase family protein [Clostridium algoriphilum]
MYNYFNFKIFGGCCGTDNTHIASIARELRALTNKDNT